MLTGSDKIAVIVYSVASELNLRVGRDLAVVGFDASVGAGLLHPPLTSVVMPVDDIARRLVGRALQQIEKGEDTGPGEIVPTWLREGKAPRRASDARPTLSAGPMWQRASYYRIDVTSFSLVAGDGQPGGR